MTRTTDPIISTVTAPDGTVHEMRAGHEDGLPSWSCTCSDSVGGAGTDLEDARERWMTHVRLATAGPVMPAPDL